jgi:hypothetical protein
VVILIGVLTATICVSDKAWSGLSRGHHCLQRHPPRRDGHCMRHGPARDLA